MGFRRVVAARVTRIAKRIPQIGGRCSHPPSPQMLSRKNRETAQKACERRDDLWRGWERDFDHIWIWSGPFKARMLKKIAVVVRSNRLGYIHIMSDT